MKNFVILGLGVALLSACQPAVPNSARGVGFDDFKLRSQQRDAELRGTGSVGLPVENEPAVTTASLNPQVNGITVPSGTDPVNGSAQGGSGAQTSGLTDAQEIAAATTAALNNSGQAPLEASPSNPAPEAVAVTGISRENDFDAVSQLRDIEADAARRTANQGRFEQVAPTALPTRDGASGPNIVQYALQTTNALGESLYTRRGIALAAKNARNCAQYLSDDLAQQEFLELGGPRRDRKALDPDGDGFACDWDPSPYRRARAQAQSGN